MWVERLKNFYAMLPKGDQASRASLEGVLLRVEQFAEGQMAWQYGAGSESLPVEDLGLLGPEEDPWGLVIVEGGAEMDEYPKAALLALLASVLYFDSVVRRRESLAGAQFPPMQIFFEEANKVLTGVSGAAADQNASASQTEQVSEVFQTFWRDGRKYKIFLHLIAQTVSALPAGILSSCNNGFFFQTKHPHDRDLIMAHIGRSEKGIVNTEYKRYLARIPKAPGNRQAGLQRGCGRVGTHAGAPVDGARQRAIRPGDPGTVGRLLTNTKEVNAYGKTTFPLDCHHFGHRHWPDGDRLVERVYSPDLGRGCQGGDCPRNPPDGRPARAAHDPHAGQAE